MGVFILLARWWRQVSKAAPEKHFLIVRPADSKSSDWEQKWTPGKVKSLSTPTVGRIIRSRAWKAAWLRNVVESAPLPPCWRQSTELNWTAKLPILKTTWTRAVRREIALRTRVKAATAPVPQPVVAGAHQAVQGLDTIITFARCAAVPRVQDWAHTRKCGNKTSKEST